MSTMYENSPIQVSQTLVDFFKEADKKNESLDLLMNYGITSKRILMDLFSIYVKNSGIRDEGGFIEADSLMNKHFGPHWPTIFNFDRDFDQNHFPHSMLVCIINWLSVEDEDWPSSKELSEVKAFRESPRILAKLEIESQTVSSRRINS